MEGGDCKNKRALCRTNSLGAKSFWASTGGRGVIAKIEEVAESNSVSAPSVKLIRYEYFQRT